MRNAMNRDDYLIRAHEFCLRGLDLPQTKLVPEDVIAIREAVEKREELRQYIKQNLSNEALAERFNVHVRTIEKAMRYETHRQVI